MNDKKSIRRIPWDEAAFGMHCFEIVDPLPSTLKSVLATPGHYTIKIDPLADKRPLHEHGFYYCDTLIEPWCTAERLVSFTHDDVAFSTEVPFEPIVEIC